MDGGRLPMFLQYVKRFYPGLCYVRSVSAFNWDHVDCVCIIVIQNKNIFVALAGGYRELYCLVGINFGCKILRAKNRTHNVVRLYIP